MQRKLFLLITNILQLNFGYKVVGLFLMLFFSALSNQFAFAQGERQVITFSGIVVKGDSAYGIPGVHIYVANARRGIVTNATGFFSMPVLTGDTIVISAVSYKKQKLIIPQRQQSAYSVMIDLKMDTTWLPVVEVFPYANEEVFKEAFLALELPSTHYDNMEKNMEQKRITYMAMNMPMDGSMNHKIFMQQQANATFNKNSITTISLLNPFAWAAFIKSVKRGDLKRKDR